MADVTLPERASVLIIGDFNVGKSTLIKYQRTKKFDDTIIPTMEIEPSIISVPVNGKELNITVKDSPGMKKDSMKFGRFVFPEFQKCAVIFFVYDKTYRPSFDLITDLKQNVDDLINRRMECFLVGNKCDQTNEEDVTLKDGKDRCSELKMDLFIEISAKEGTNVEELFHKAALCLKDMELHFGSTKELPKSEITPKNCRC
ncbi:RAB8B [Mytilus edulis]|uniref:RAB8B n=1 Tax=Mytilus edulis TaxID=6550 RepID=A0A8S3TK18_MYTED|nr:RAB8B [Mytilus edulis]